jgi:hypothetical protein
VPFGKVERSIKDNEVVKICCPEISNKVLKPSALKYKIELVGLG